MGEMRTTELRLDTSGRELVDLTDDVVSFCSGAEDGLCNIFVPHATAGLAVVETGAGSEEDLADLVGRLFPKEHRYVHSHGSRGHGADHLTPTVFAPSLVIPVVSGTPQLGTWQHVVLVDRNPDNPHRTVRLSFLEA